MDSPIEKFWKKGEISELTKLPKRNKNAGRGKKIFDRRHTPKKGQKKARHTPRRKKCLGWKKSFWGVNAWRVGGEMGALISTLRWGGKKGWVFRWGEKYRKGTSEKRKVGREGGKLSFKKTIANNERKKRSKQLMGGEVAEPERRATRKKDDLN